MTLKPDPGLTSEMLLQLRARAAEVMAIEKLQTDPGSSNVAFIGELKLASDLAFARIERRLAEIGFIPLLREAESDRQMLVVMRGPASIAVPQRRWLSLTLLVLTFASTVFAGATIASQIAGPARPLAWNTGLQDGIPFALVLLGMLVAHEFGHFAMARRHGVPVSLPYFVPMPFGLGTLGGFVQMRGSPRDRRVLFDVGIAGPLAGLVVVIPAFVIGVLIAELAPGAAPATRPMLAEWLIALFRSEASGHGLLFNPVLMAARTGMALTMLNLLPIGMFDGGHIAYAALGTRWYRWISIATFIVIGLLIMRGSTQWFVVLLFGWVGMGRHLPTRDDITPLDPARSAIFLGAALLFLAMFSAQPF